MPRLATVQTADVTKPAHRPLLRIRRRIAEHVDEDRRDQLGGLLLGFAAQADDAFCTGEQVDDAALLGYRRSKQLKLGNVLWV